MHLLLFLLLLLQASLVQGDFNYTSTDFNLRDGFPAGSLITVYFLHIPQSDENLNRVRFDLYGETGQLHFRLDNRKVAVTSNGLLKEEKEWSPTTEEGAAFWVIHDVARLPPTTNGDWWRLDLYKINDTAFLPFFQGIHAGIRTMKGVSDPRSMSIGGAGSFDPEEVTIEFFPLNKHSSKSGRVLASMDPRESSRITTIFTTLDSFPDGDELKLSVMMVSYHNDNEQFRPEPMLYFYSKGKGWAFGLETIWDQSKRRPNLRLFTRTKGATKNDKEAPCLGTNADLVHARLERVGTTIKARIDYKDGWQDRYECEMDVGVEAAKHLDGPLALKGYHGAALLYFATEDLYYY